MNNKDMEDYLDFKKSYCDWDDYEKFKKKIQNLAPDEYEEAIKKYCRRKYL